MANLEIQNYDMGGVVIGNPLYDDGLLAFPGADDYAEGTILAFLPVAVGAVAATGTGNGTVTGFALSNVGEPPKVGNYNLECIVAVTNGGIFKLEDPDGNLVANNIEINPAGAGLTVVYVGNGITFTITDAGTDFIVGDKFALAVAALNKWVIFNPAGVGGAEEPRGILTIAASAAGAGDVSVRPLIKGKVRTEKLVIDGGASVTDEIKNQLRKYSIFCIDVDELNVLDNQ